MPHQAVQSSMNTTVTQSSTGPSIQISVNLNNPNSSPVSRTVGYALGQSPDVLDPFYVAMSGEKHVTLAAGESSVSFVAFDLNQAGVYLPFDLAVLVGKQGVDLKNEGLKDGKSRLPSKQYLDDYSFKHISSI